GRGHRRAFAQRHGRVQRGHHLVLAREVHAIACRNVRGGRVAARTLEVCFEGNDHSRSRKPRTAGPKRPKSTRKASWPCGESMPRNCASAPPRARPSATSCCCCTGNRSEEHTSELQSR